MVVAFLVLGFKLLYNNRLNSNSRLSSTANLWRIAHDWLSVVLPGVRLRQCMRRGPRVVQILQVISYPPPFCRPRVFILFIMDNVQSRPTLVEEFPCEASLTSRTECFIQSNCFFFCGTVNVKGGIEVKGLKHQKLCCVSTGTTLTLL